MPASVAPGPRGESLGRDAGSRRRGWSAVTAVALVAISLATVLWVAALPSPQLPKTVRASPDAVLLTAPDIPEEGWGLRASGANGTGAWRLFSVHNERVLAFLNVTLWVETDGAAAVRTFANVSGSVAYPVRDGRVAGSDASLFWNAGSGRDAGMVVRRYNVVFVLSAYLESSWDLTRSDLGSWSGWQLARVEAVAA